VCAIFSKLMCNCLICPMSVIHMKTGAVVLSTEINSLKSYLQKDSEKKRKKKTLEHEQSALKKQKSDLISLPAFCHTSLPEGVLPLEEREDLLEFLGASLPWQSPLLSGLNLDAASSKTLGRKYVAEYHTLPGNEGATEGSENVRDERQKETIKTIFCRVRTSLQAFLKYMTNMYPLHEHTMISVMITDKQGKKQRIHLDYDVPLLTSISDKDSLPFSVIIPLHDHCMFVLEGTLPRAVSAGEYLLFRGDQEHGGGSNTLGPVAKKYIYRLHIYFGVEKAHIPIDKVYTISE